MRGSRWDAKRWPRPLAEKWPLDRGLSFIILYNYFAGFITGRLRGWPLNEGSTVVMWHMRGLPCHACMSGMLNEVVLSCSARLKFLVNNCVRVIIPLDHDKNTALNLLMWFAW